MKMSLLKRRIGFLFSFLSLLLMSVQAQAQQITISGVISDPSGEAIIGATILEEGSANGTITDFNGKFTLSTSVGSKIKVSYISYVTQTFTVTAQKTYTIILKEDSEVLDEVVVVGYGVVKKNDATGSVTAMKPDAINKGLNTNPQDMLKGKIAGVNVTTSGGAPGSGATIRIRGGSSLSASNDPLIVIDGLAMDNNGIQGVSNPLSMINPNDIETYTVLKDASATAIYGSRASNGVIIITTKRGKKGSKPRVSYEGNVSVSNNKSTLDVGTGDFMRAYANYYYAGKSQLSKLGTANTDWQDEIYRVAVSTDHNINVTGGTKNMPYRVSAGFTDQNGILKTSAMQRATLAANVNPSFLDDHLKFNVNLKTMYIHTNYADEDAIGAAVFMDPTQSVRMDGNSDYDVFGGYYQTIQNANFGDDSWTTTKNSLATGNPVAMLEQKDDRANAYSIVGNVQGDYTVQGFEDLHIHANFGYDYSTGKQNTDVSPYSGTNNYYGYYGMTDKYKYNAAFNTYAQYSKELSGDQHFDVMAGYEWQHFFQHSKWDNYGLYPSTNTEHAGEYYNRIQQYWESESYLVSFFSRLNYSLLNRYLFTATVRQDGTSRFSEDNRWGTFPSFALGWKIKEESFLQDVTWLTQLKLRLGYGITGQQNINQGDYPYIPTYQWNNDHAYYPDGETSDDGSVNYGSTLRPNAYNSDLKWEQTTTYNAGLDYGVFHNRITGSVDYYYRETDDLINVVDIPAGTNFKNRVVSNVGSLTNKGIEFAINTKPIVGKFTWDLGFNVTHNSNEITKLTMGEDEDYYIATGGISYGTGSNIQAHAVGHAASSFYVYETGYDENGVFGAIDRDGDGSITAGDKVFYHSPDADLTYGLTSKMTYKDWDFSFSMHGSIGNYVYNDVLANHANVGKSGIYSAKNGGFNNVLYDAFDPYFSQVSAAASGKMNSEWYMYDYYVQDASFLRIDNITVGYTFKGKDYSARVYGTVQNPFVFTAYDGLDPEVYGGIDNNIYPRPMISLIGLSLQF